MKILKTREALVEGYWSVSEHHFKEWQKYSVVDEKSKLIYVTADTVKECENYINYLDGLYVTPEFFKHKVRQYWRKNK